MKFSFPLNQFIYREMRVKKSTKHLAYFNVQINAHLKHKNRHTFENLNQILLLQNFLYKICLFIYCIFIRKFLVFTFDILNIFVHKNIIA